MLWRSETVIVFHKIAKKDSKTTTTQTTCHVVVKATTNEPMGPAARVIARHGPLPNFAETFGASNPPKVPPTAPAVPKTAKVNTDVCSTSCANKIKVAPTIVPRPFIDPKIIAMGRSNGWAHSHAYPSLISVLKLIFSRGFSSATGLNVP